MTFSVALAMLRQRDGWLLQLRDDINGIAAPGCWGLFGGHLELGESPEAALRRELDEEIGWCPANLQPWLSHNTAVCTAHVFVGNLHRDLNQLALNEGQDMTLATYTQLLSGRIFSPKLNETRPLAPILEIIVSRLQEVAHNRTEGFPHSQDSQRIQKRRS